MELGSFSSLLLRLVADVHVVFVLMVLELLVNFGLDDIGEEILVLGLDLSSALGDLLFLLGLESLDLLDVLDGLDGVFAVLLLLLLEFSLLFLYLGVEVLSGWGMEYFMRLRFSSARRCSYCLALWSSSVFCSAMSDH